MGPILVTDDTKQRKDAPTIGVAVMDWPQFAGKTGLALHL
jgi:hypothetical protein